MEINSEAHCGADTEVGWYILAENQQHVGPYEFSELQGGHDDAKVSIPATIILHNMFTPAELRYDESLIPELQADVREECIKLGPAESVKVCENHPQGVVLVRFNDRRDGAKCIELMNGRWFGGRQLRASEDDGSINHARVRDLDDDASRLEQFGAELEAD